MSPRVRSRNQMIENEDGSDMIVGDEAGRVSSVFRNMMKQNNKSEEES